MKLEPIVPARLEFDAEGRPCSTRYGDIYHPRGGAAAQARHVFLAGCGLPGRWQGHDRFVVLETGFGLGHNFLATWQAWRDDPERAARLVFISIELHPLAAADLALAHRDGAWPALAAELRARWPPATPDLHRLAFDAGRVELLLGFGDVQTWLRALDAEVDAFYLDGFAPTRNPRMWDARVCKALGRLAAPGATLATWSAAGALRRDLTSAGFEVRRAPGKGGKREITLARFAPRFTPRRSPRAAAPLAAAAPAAQDAADPAALRPAARVANGVRAAADRRHALIIGAGLAGCAAADALAEQGWRCTLVDRGAGVATAASGNPAGLFHGVVHAADGPHTRFGRSAALHAAATLAQALDAGVAGAIDGLLRLEHRLDLGAMRSLLDDLGLPVEYVDAFSADQASAAAGIPVGAPCWFYPSGGWVDPRGLAAWLLSRSKATLHCKVDVARLQRQPAGWTLLDAAGATIAEAPVVVLANGCGAAALAQSAVGDAAAPSPPRSAATAPGEAAVLSPPGVFWPLETRRGQLSIAPAADLDLPRLPIAGSGYLLPRIGDAAIFGATSQVDDADPTVRPADHLANLLQLERLLGRPSGLALAALTGRTAWRCASADRLPLIGAVPDIVAPGARLEQPRQVARLPGLFVFAGLGSRGITWCSLGARILAGAVSGAPAPADRSLLDAVDPARYLSRRARAAEASGRSTALSAALRV